MLKLVMFDMDGTIGDTLPLCVAAFEKSVLSVTGRTVPREKIYSSFGPSEEGIIRTLVPDKWVETVEEYLRYYDELHDMCAAPFDGIMDALEFLAERGVLMGLVTGKGIRSAEITLSRYGVKRFFCDIEAGSPDGDFKDAAMRRIMLKRGVEPADALYVGDSVQDVHSSRRAGVRIFSAAWADTADKQALEKAAPDAVLDSVAELVPRLKEELGYL